MQRWQHPILPPILLYLPHPASSTQTLVLLGTTSPFSLSLFSAILISHPGGVSYLLDDGLWVVFSLLSSQPKYSHRWPEEEKES